MENPIPPGWNSEFSSHPLRSRPMILEKNGFNSYVTMWFEQTLQSTETYREPIIDDTTAQFMMMACGSLKQDVHVFVSSVETLEHYIRVKDRMEATIEDPLLAAVCVIFLCSKYAGGQSDLRASYIEEFLERVSNKRYNSLIIKKAEFDIFRTIKGKFPLHTLIDDMNVLLETYVKTMNLKADLHHLCTAILKLYYASRKKIFAELKSTYQQNSQGYYALRQCVCKRLYFPSGILLCALKMTICRNFLDLEKISKDLGQMASVHEDHLQFLCEVIYDTASKECLV